MHALDDQVVAAAVANDEFDNLGGAGKPPVWTGDPVNLSGLRIGERPATSGRRAGGVVPLVELRPHIRGVVVHPGMER